MESVHNIKDVLQKIKTELEDEIWGGNHADDYVDGYEDGVA